MNLYLVFIDVINRSHGSYVLENDYFCEQIVKQCVYS